MPDEFRIRWCCRWFRDTVSQAGRSGLGIFVDDCHGAGTRFVMQHRAMDEGAKGPEYTASPLTLISQVGIQFCPWCGRALKRYYRLHLAALSRPDLSIPLD